jgi:hypothetical protein
VTNHEELLDLVPLYAADALGDDELRQVEEHLDGCPDCIAEVAALRTAASAMVPDEPPPTHVWDRIVAEISGPVAPTATVAEIDSRRSSRRFGWLAAAAVVAVVLGAWGIIRAVSTEELLGPDATVAAAEEAADSPGAVVRELLVDGEAVARVVLTTEGEGFLVPSGLVDLDDDRTYQLWVVTPDDLVISAGVLGSEPLPSRFTWQGQAAAFVLTREVAGGVTSSAGDVVAVAEG